MYLRRQFAVARQTNHEARSVVLFNLDNKNRARFVSNKRMLEQIRNTPSFEWNVNPRRIFDEIYYFSNYKNVTEITLRITLRYFQIFVYRNLYTKR